MAKQAPQPDGGQTSERLPSFKHPPVIETVLGVQFDRLPGLTNAHLGAFWRWLQTLQGAEWKGLSAQQWTDVTDVPAIDPVAEEFGDEQSWGPLVGKLKLTQDPSSRLQIRNHAKDRMIQVQNGRVHYNWVKKDDAPYPRYTSIRPDFDEVMNALTVFLAEAKLGEAHVNQWEVTYVNIFRRGTVWERLADLRGLLRLPPVLGAAVDPLKLETFRGSWHYQIPPQRGRLHIELQHGRTALGGGEEEVLKMILTARGPVGDVSGDDTGWGRGLDLGRAAIVRTFLLLTSPEAHAYWGLEHDSA
ncbi:MAG TPA: TIGR04255 family protein [Phycisphaerae bacterium]|nr:TIGR04255 family protein [Phycisphaerae bacterium]HNU45792.1 TIGR04255 family protein [Phycisphaerae bacterium]